MQVEHHQPGPEWIDRLRATCADGVIKLAPACKVPPAWAEVAELEWIARDRECRQQVVWLGSLAKYPGRRRATVVAGGETASPGVTCCCCESSTCETHSFAGEGGLHVPSTASLEQYIYDPSSALLAADLLGAFAQKHGLTAVAPGAVYLTASHRVHDPLVSSFEVVDTYPLRTMAIAGPLAAKGIGRLEIKKRGVTTDPEELRRQLKLHGPREATLLLTRMGQREVAILAKR